MKRLFMLALAMAFIGGSMASTAQAFDLGSFLQRVDEKTASLVGGGNDDRREKAQNIIDEVLEQNNEGGDEGSQACEVDFDLERADLRLSQGELALMLRADTEIEVDDGDPGQPLAATLAYTGEVEFLRGTMPLPDNQTFNGGRTWNVPGGDSEFEFSGQAIGSAVLASLSRSDFGEDDELEGRVHLTGTISGCDTQQFAEEFEFEIEEGGQVDIGRW